MIDGSTISVAAQGAGMGFGFGGAFLVVRWIATFIAGRWDKREEHLDGATQRLFDRMEKQIEGLATRVQHAETSLAECERQHSESRAEVAELRATLQGYGQAREHAALIVAADRAANKEAKR
jgi:chromosome segregation ATPase